MPIEKPFRIIRHDGSAVPGQQNLKKPRSAERSDESANTQEDNCGGARVSFSESKRLIGGTLSALSV